MITINKIKIDSLKFLIKYISSYGIFSKGYFSFYMYRELTNDGHGLKNIELFDLK